MPVFVQELNYPCPHCRNSSPMTYRKETRCSLRKIRESDSIEIYEEKAVVVCTKCNNVVKEITASQPKQTEDIPNLRKRKTV